MIKFKSSDYKKYSKFLNNLAGKLTKFYYSKLNKPFKVSNKLKGRGYDPVTSADKAFEKFIIKEIDKTRDYKVAVMADDGAGIWVNGSRVGVVNMDAKQLKVNGLAKSENEDKPLKFKGWVSIPHNKLKSGLNVVAIQVHPSSSRTSDFLFDSKLVSRPKGLGGNKKKK